MNFCLACMFRESVVSLTVTCWRWWGWVTGRETHIPTNSQLRTAPPVRCKQHSSSGQLQQCSTNHPVQAMRMILSPLCHLFLSLLIRTLAMRCFQNSQSEVVLLEALLYREHKTRQKSCCRQASLPCNPLAVHAAGPNPRQLRRSEMEAH